MAADKIVKLKVADGEWARSEFPHPLVTLDFAEDGHLIAVSAPAEYVTSYGAMKFEVVGEDGR